MHGCSHLIGVVQREGLPSFLQQLFSVLVGGEACGQIADSVAEPGKSGQGQASRFLSTPHPSLPHRLCSMTVYVVYVACWPDCWQCFGF